MSHFTQIKTKMVEKEFIIESLKAAGYNCEVGKLEIRGYGGSRLLVEIKVPTKNAGYDIGFRISGDSYELVADWYGIKDINQQQLVQQLTQGYAYHASKAKLEEQGFSLVNEQREKDGQIRLVLRRIV